MYTSEERSRKFYNALFYIGFALLFMSWLMPFDVSYVSDFRMDDEYPYRPVVSFGFAKGITWINLVAALIVLIASETATPFWKQFITLLISLTLIPGIIFYNALHSGGNGGPFGGSEMYGFYVMIAGTGSILLAAFLKAQFKSEND